MRPLSKIALFLYGLGFFVALWHLQGRFKAEAQHDQTEILIDGGALDAWVRQQEQDPSDFLKKLRESGIHSVAVPALHLDSLQEEGLLVAQSEFEVSLLLKSGALQDPQSEVHNFLAQNSGGTYLLFEDEAFGREMVSQLKQIVSTELAELLQGRLIWLPVPEKSLRRMGLGFDKGVVARYTQAGFSIWLRPENQPGLSSEDISALFREWKSLPEIEGVIFAGGLNEALGYPDNLVATGNELAAANWKVGYIESAPAAQQKGVESLVRSLPGQTVRVLAVSPAHQAKLSPYRVLGMYSLGARERNIRLLYVRPYAVPGRPELDQDFLFSLAQELKASGEADTFDEEKLQGPGLVPTVLMALAGAAMTLLLLEELGLTFAAWWFLILIPFAGLAVLGELAHKAILVRSLFALGISIVTPTWAFLRWVYPSVGGPEPGKNAWISGCKSLILTSLCSVSAGLFLAALLSDVTFLLGLDRFRGVKLLTLGAPLLIVLCFVIKRYSVKEWMGGLKANVAIYQVLLAGILLGLFGFLYLRTGNNAGGAASDTERTLRVFLDRLLGVRPRFKEFMVAHPAMICAPLGALLTGFLPSLVLVLLAAVGQPGIVDTFAHVHTPLTVTLIRVFLGVLFGALVGSVAYGLTNFLASYSGTVFKGGEDSE